MTTATHDQIGVLAHQLWEQAGRPDRRDDEFWQQAEQQLQQRGDLGEFGPAPPTLLPG